MTTVSPIRAHLLRDVPPEDLDRIRRRLGVGLRLTGGPDLPEDRAIDVLVCGRPTREQIEALPGLRVLLIPYAGLPAETRDLMREFPGVAVHNLHHNAAPTTEMALALLLAAAKRIVPSDRALRAGAWSGRGRESEAVLLEGRTALVVGFGTIGRRLARGLRALGLEVVGVRRRATTVETIEGIPVHPAAALHDLLPAAGVIVLCAPLTDETRGLLGARELGLLPDGSVLVNIARGPVVDEDALFEALRTGPLGAAGIDVWYRYPGRDGDPLATPPANRPFHELDNVVMSPHRSGSVRETEALRMEHLIESLAAAAEGREIPHRVDLGAGY